MVNENPNAEFIDITINKKYKLKSGHYSKIGLLLFADTISKHLNASLAREAN